MTILDAPPPGWKRPTPSPSLKLKVMFKRYGHHQIDHRPPLSERPFDTRTNDTIPPANDLNFLEALLDKEHDNRTNGPGGEKRITTVGGDTHARAKRVRILETQDEHTKAMRRKLLRPTRRRKKRKAWASRPFQSRGRGHA